MRLILNFRRRVHRWLGRSPWSYGRPIISTAFGWPYSPNQSNRRSWFQTKTTKTDLSIVIERSWLRTNCSCDLGLRDSATATNFRILASSFYADRTNRSRALETVPFATLGRRSHGRDRPWWDFRCNARSARMRKRDAMIYSGEYCARWARGCLDRPFVLSQSNRNTTTGRADEWTFRWRGVLPLRNYCMHTRSKWTRANFEAYGREITRNRESGAYKG